MQFDVTDFLMAMTKMFVQCQQDGATETPPEMLKNGMIVRFAIRQALRQQARKQGANRKQRREFVAQRFDQAEIAINRAIEKNFPT